MSVSAEDREKELADALGPVLDAARTDWAAGPSNRAHWVDRLVAVVRRVGWGPGGAPARPTRDDLAEAIGALDAAKNREIADSGEYETWITILVDELADALLAADHLWAEHPSAPVVGRAALWTRIATIIEPAWREDHVRGERMDDVIARAEAGTDLLFASGVFVDRASVEREAAAKAVEDLTVEPVAQRRNVELIERAAEYREGKR